MLGTNELLKCYCPVVANVLLSVFLGGRVLGYVSDATRN